MSRDQWPMFGEYSAEAICEALDEVPAAVNLRPGTLLGGGPVVRFDLGPDVAGGVGCFREGEYLIVVGWYLADAEPGQRVFNPTSRTCARAGDIPALIGELAAAYTRERGLSQ
jgi:hypothetical protein